MTLAASKPFASAMFAVKDDPTSESPDNSTEPGELPDSGLTVLSLQALNARIIDDAINDFIFIIVLPIPEYLLLIF
jgi:hypothetical protein